ncbi:TRAP transporter large permease, partial [Dehalococcoidia bacterium]|nr:TRAP transporter large permease [Dehalococcoidia bacterium]
MLIGSALALVGFLGMASVAGFDAGFGLMGIVPYASTAKYAMCVIPFFVLMGEFCFQAGLSRDLYQTAHKWLGHVRGGLAMATVAACGAFAAVSGSSLATAATMSAVALPEMKRYGYRDTLAAGCIAAGGTVGVLIPPSTILIIYGILTEQSITKLFLAGIFPGLLSVLYYMVTIYITCRISPGLGPAALRSNFRERVVSLKNTWAVLVLFGLVMGGMVGGLFTPTEAGAIGAFGALFFMLIKRRLSGQSLLNSLLETGRTTAMVFLIFIGTMIFGYFLAVTRLPMEFAAFAAGLPIPPFAVFGGILLVYLLLGCIMGVLPMVLLTVPIFYPVVVALGFDPIWFGVMIVMVVEIGLITPPVGMNVFIIKGVAKDIPLPTIFRGVVPFLIADFARVATMMLFPQIALFLPGLV